MIWPYGGEHWCNLEGKYLHIVSDMSHLAGQDYETSICSLGVIGTRYMRRGEYLLPAEITLRMGEKWSFSLPHIESEIEIGTKLAIAVREKSNSNLIKIQNWTTQAHLVIDTKGIEEEERVEIVLESYNTLSKE